MSHVVGCWVVYIYVIPIVHSTVECRYKKNAVQHSTILHIETKYALESIFTKATPYLASSVMVSYVVSFERILVKIHDDIIKWNHFPRYWPFVREIHRSPVNFPHKGQWRGALMFYLICVWINGWVNNREAGDLRRHRGHYDVIVMWPRLKDTTLYSNKTTGASQWATPQWYGSCHLPRDHRQSADMVWRYFS